MDVTVSTDDPNAFTKNMLLYGFEEGDDQSPGKYLGEFRVDAVSEKAVGAGQHHADGQIHESKVKLLADNVMESKSPWVLYEMMPTDEHEAFANLSEDQKKWVTDEFLKDGQTVDANGKISQDRQTDKKFERPLRDYLAIFRACEMHRTLFDDRQESATRDLNYLKAASEEAKKPGGRGGKGEDPGRRRTAAGPSRTDGSGKSRWLPGKTCSPSSRRSSKRRLPRTSRKPRKLPGCRKKLADRDRSPHPRHGTIRTEDKLTEWASTIATTTAKDAAVFG